MCSNDADAANVKAQPQAQADCVPTAATSKLWRHRARTLQPQ